MASQITILAVTARRVVIGLDGTPYIENDTEVAVRVREQSQIGVAFAHAERRFPNALSFEIYKPRTDSSEVNRL